MTTRSRKPATNKKGKDDNAPSTKPITQTLPPSVPNPPHVCILPKDISAEARVITLPDPATSTPSRYLICPEKGCYGFTKIAPPRREGRSWLLTPEQIPTSIAHGEETDGEGYVLQIPDLMIATPIDPLFLLLPALAQVAAESGKNAFLTLSDYLDKLGECSEHFEEVRRSTTGRDLDGLFEVGMRAACEEMVAGDECLYRLDLSRLLTTLIDKAERMVACGLPASMEERFVTQALVVPVLSIRREESGVSIAGEDIFAGGAESETTSASTSQDTQTSSGTATSTSTAATSIPSPPPAADPSAPSEDIKHLLRLHTAFTFLLSSYIPRTLHPSLQNLLSNAPSPRKLDFAPLTSHLAYLAKLKKEANALRSLGENISRKRGIEDDDEAKEKAETKKRKKEEEEMKKKSVSRGVQMLAKADTSGMRKMSAFFGKAPGKGKS